MERLPLTEADYAKLAQLLRRVDLFSALTVGQLESILPSVLFYEYRARERVVSQGEPGDALYLIHAGTAEVRSRRWLLFSRRLAELGPGDFFGEMALLSQERRSATVVCREPCRFFVLLASDFRFILEKDPALAGQMRRTADRRRFLSARGG